MSLRWKPYVPVAKRRAKAAKKVKQLSKQGKRIEPVKISDRTIAHTFWGKAWCTHLEAFSDFANRLPRGRTYVRNGSVVHLAIDEGAIEALVSGSELYQIRIEIEPLPEESWQRLRKQTSGRIGSLLELLQGHLSDQVMAIVTDRDQGLFPKPDEIQMKCNCPDWASLCKHLAAVLYGIGARLDHQPELLFKLRGVDHKMLISDDIDLDPNADGAGHRRLETDQLSGLFGIEIDTSPPPDLKPQSKPTQAVGPNNPGSEFTAEDIARLRQRFGMNKPQFARLIGISPITVGNWEKATGHLRLHRRNLSKLRQVARLTVEEARKRLLIR